jgi:hypothetical protein
MAKAVNKPESGTPPAGNTNGTPPAGESAPVAAPVAAPERETADGVKRIRHPGKAGKGLIVGARLVEFDAEGVAELDEAEAAMLLSMNCGYETAECF